MPSQSALISVHLSINAQPTGWRQRAAQALRRWATGLDGRPGFVVAIRTEPALEAAEIDAAITAGFAHAHRLLLQGADLAVRDRWHREADPELYAAADPGQPRRRPGALDSSWGARP